VEGQRPTSLKTLEPSIKSQDARQSKNKSVTINEKANKVNPLEEKQRELDIKRREIKIDEERMHDPTTSIRQQFIKNEG
jgi:hypothetical protein